MTNFFKSLGKHAKKVGLAAGLVWGGMATFGTFLIYGAPDRFARFMRVKLKVERPPSADDIEKARQAIHKREDSQLMDTYVTQAVKYLKSDDDKQQMYYFIKLLLTSRYTTKTTTWYLNTLMQKYLNQII